MAASKGTSLAVMTAMKVVHEDMAIVNANELDTFSFVAAELKIGEDDVVCVIARREAADDLRKVVRDRGGKMHVPSDEIQGWLQK